MKQDNAREVHAIESKTKTRRENRSKESEGDAKQSE